MGCTQVNNDIMDELKIQEEIIEPNFSDDKRMLKELKERMEKEYRERVKKYESK